MSKTEPKVLDMAHVASKWGWTTKKVTQLLVKAGCVDDVGVGKIHVIAGKSRKHGRGIRYVTTRARIREKFPGLARLL